MRVLKPWAVWAVLGLLVVASFKACEDPPRRPDAFVPSAAPAPSAAELERQRRNAKMARVMADPKAAALYQRLSSVEYVDFCSRELARIRAIKDLSGPMLEAMQAVAQTHGVHDDEFDMVRRKTIDVGMSECALLASWGRPERVNETVTALGTRSQWVYGLGNYVYVSAEKVTSFQIRR